MDKAQEVKKMLDKITTSRQYGYITPGDKENASKEIVKLFTPPTDEGLRDALGTYLIKFFCVTCKSALNCEEFCGEILNEADNLNKYLLALLQQVIERDYVRLDKDQTLPPELYKFEDFLGVDPRVVEGWVKQDMVNAGWRKVT